MLASTVHFVGLSALLISPERVSVGCVSGISHVAGGRARWRSRGRSLAGTPVPEPSAANVLIMGLGILVLVQARDRFTTTRRS